MKSYWKVLCGVVQDAIDKDFIAGFMGFLC